MSSEQVRNSQKRKWMRGTVIFVLWLAIWQAVYLFVGQDVLFAAPADVIRRLAQLIPQSDFWITVWSSLGRILAGLLLGITVGIALAVLTSASRLLADFLSPLISIIKSTPVTSFIILALLWIARARVPVFIAFLMVLPIIWANVFEGIRQRDERLREMATLYKMKPLTRLRLVDIPMVLPYFTAAFNSALGLAWKAGITAEVIGNPRFSIGGQIYSAKVYLETTDLFAWTAVLIIISVALEKGFRLLIRKGTRLLHIQEEAQS